MTVMNDMYCSLNLQIKLLIKELFVKMTMNETISFSVKEKEQILFLR